MKPRILLNTGLLAGIVFSLSSCIDDKYDLDNIDKTSALKLNNLSIPVNLDTVTLDEVLKVDENPDNPIKIFTDSQGRQYYAIEKSGEFSAEEVFVDELKALDNATVKEITVPNASGSISSLSTTFSYRVSNVDNSIISVLGLGLKQTDPMEINFIMTSDTGVLPTIENVVLQLPVGFKAQYKGKTIEDGIVNVGAVKDGRLDSPINVYEMNFGEGLRPSDNILDITGELGIKSATLSDSGSGNLTFSFILSPFTASSISGEIDYRIESPEIQPISLEDLPDFLKEGETNLILNNPQIYLDFANPLGADFETTLNIEPQGEETNPLTVSLNPFQNTIILAADIKDLPLENEYPTDVKQEVSELQYILSGNGLPESIQFNLENTSVKGLINNFELGSYKQVAGRYSFFTLLAFAKNSQIIYSKKETDFFGDDVKNVEISNFVLTASPFTNLPFDVTLIVSPLDKEGNIIKNSNNREITATSIINKFADGTNPLKLEFSEPFNGLDGVYFSVTIDNLEGETLSPDQYIRLENIRARITGEYVTDF